MCRNLVFKQCFINTEMHGAARQSRSVIKTFLLPAFADPNSIVPEGLGLVRHNDTVIASEGRAHVLVKVCCVEPGLPRLSASIYLGEGMLPDGRVIARGTSASVWQILGTCNYRVSLTRYVYLNTTT
jgi:hypothetical protein